MTKTVKPEVLDLLSDDLLDETRALVLYWCLHILVPLKGHKQFISRRNGYTNSRICELLGLENYAEETNLNFNDAMRLLQERYQCYGMARPVVPAILGHNIGALADTLSLSETERWILTFTTVIHNSEELHEAAEMLGAELNSQQAMQLLAGILELPLAEVQRALAPNSTLASAGLVRLDRDCTHNLRNKLDLLPGLADALTIEQSKPEDLLQSFFALASPAKLKPKDFAYITADYDLLRSYLQSATKKRLKGVNILIHGPPGTGKTQLVRTLARDLRLKLYEVKASDLYGNSIKGKNRFGAYQLGQRVLERTPRCLILFDEIEDVFPSAWDMLFDKESDASSQKSWINQLLETNPIPALWLSNQIDHIDDAFLRRFDYVLELREPSREARRRIFVHYLDKLSVTEKWLDRLAEHPNLTPAHIERAVKVVSHLPLQNSEQVQRAFEKVLGNSLEAMRLPRKPPVGVNQAITYRLDLLNADSDLDAIIQGLQQHPHGRFCLYGPPGTGKTAFGQHLARLLDRPLLLQRASDLLGPFVGQTEQNIAQMFQQAERDQAVLLVDEADSFLQSRAQAQRSWEFSQVNELLVQMENFEGIFIASTNLVNTLDAASLRRFDIKIRFDFLKPTQAWSLFTQVLAERGFDQEQLPASMQQLLAQLDTLTPGDFATVLRQYRITRKELGPQQLLTALQRECRMKPDAGKRGMGFSATL